MSAVGSSLGNEASNYRRNKIGSGSWTYIRDEESAPAMPEDPSGAGWGGSHKDSPSSRNSYSVPFIAQLPQPATPASSRSGSPAAARSRSGSGLGGGSLSGSSSPGYSVREASPVGAMPRSPLSRNNRGLDSSYPSSSYGEHVAPARALVQQASEAESQPTSGLARSIVCRSCYALVVLGSLGVVFGAGGGLAAVWGGASSERAGGMTEAGRDSGDAAATADTEYDEEGRTTTSPPGFALGIDGLCDLEAPLPNSTHPLWELDPLWRRACEQNNRPINFWQYPEDRNWCWIGFKYQCHADLKNHRPWKEIQFNAAKLGYAPSGEDSRYSPIEKSEVCDIPEAGRARGWTYRERAEARTWFKNNVAVYVLGLQSAVERWNTAHARLQELDIYGTHIYGVDMREEGIENFAKKQGWIPEEYNFTHAQQVAYSDKHQMGPILGTMGCATAHFKAHEKVLADGMPLAVVLEDDSKVDEDFVERIWDLVHRELPCDWEVASLYSRCPFGTCVSRHLMRVQPDTNEPFWRCRQGVNWGMQGTLYRTSKLRGIHKFWKPTVFDSDRPHCMDLDVALASISDKVAYYAVPSVQEPGFLIEMDQGSARWSINQAGTTQKPTGPTTTTIPMAVPRLLPPGAF